MNYINSLSIIYKQTCERAENVFHKLSRKQAIKKLLDSIVKIVRVDQDDPLAAWDKHNATLEQAKNKLNDKAYTKLIFKAPGTNLEIGLPKGHIWHGGAAESEKGTIFNPNMPTEEVFTAPHKYEVNGTVKSTLPLNHGGTLIDEFSLTFKDGAVVDFSAEQGDADR